jgi:hypothetical protein
MESADRKAVKVVDRETLLAYEAPPAPPDLADRILAGLRARESARPRRARWMILAAAMGVAAAALLILSRGGGDSGRRVATARESIAIGSRAVAVAEAGAELSWNVTEDGEATVEQRSGDVFYRVEPGSAFVVRLPGATIRVLGTCFRVEVTDVRGVRSTSKLLVAGGVGAALSAAVLVTVYEGRVLLENPRGQLELSPGEQGRVASAAPAAAPDPTAATAETDSSVHALQNRVRDLEHKLNRSNEELAAARRTGAPDSARMFEAEERDPSWAPDRERRIEERLTRFLGVEEGRAAVECRRSCCQITLDLESDEEKAAVITDLQTDVGLNHLDRDRSIGRMFGSDENGMTLVTLCVNREERGPGPAHHPDRGAEREALLAAARPAFEVCMATSREPLDLATALSIDKSGAISNVESDAAPLNHPASECVERAILSAARFAPSDKDTFIHVRLHLDPPS